MPEIGAITGLLTSFKTMKDISKSISDAHDESIAQQKAIELLQVIGDAQQKMLEAQSAYYELLDTNRTLKEENTSLKETVNLRNRYTLHKTSVGSYVYELKHSLHNEEAEHYACQICLDSGRKTVLQPYNPGYSLKCNHCCTHIDIAHQTRVQTAARTQRRKDW